MPEYTSDTLDLTALPFWQWGINDGPSADIDMGIPFDSIHRPREVMDTMFRKSLFQRHSLQVQHRETLARPDNSEPVWIFATLLILSGLICLYFHLRKINFIDLLRTLVDRRAMDRVVRDCNLNRTAIMLPMGLLLVLALCLPVHHLAMPQTGPGGYLLLSAGVGLLYILRNAILRLLGNTFESRPSVNLYITNNYFFHLVEATVITVMLLPLFYMPGAQTTMQYVVGGFVAVAFVMRLGRGIKVFLTLPNSSSFYLFYYLCIVELIPILALIKWIIYNGSVS